MTRLFVTGTFRDKTFRYRDFSLQDRYSLHMVTCNDIILYFMKTRPATIIIEEEEEWFN